MFNLIAKAKGNQKLKFMETYQIINKIFLQIFKKSIYF